MPIFPSDPSRGLTLASLALRGIWRRTITLLNVEPLFGLSGIHSEAVVRPISSRSPSSGIYFSTSSLVELAPKYPPPLTIGNALPVAHRRWRDPLNALFPLRPAILVAPQSLHLLLVRSSSNQTS